MAAEQTRSRPQWAAELLGQFDAADRDATRVASGLTLAQLNWRQADDQWSVGQCLEHLAMANEVYLPAIERALAGRPVGVVQEVTPGWLGRWFLRNVIEPTPTTARRRAPREIKPPVRVDGAILDRFHRTNANACDVVRRASRLDVNHIRFRNPFVPLIRFTIGTGFVILATHQRRHLLQAERIRRASGFPAS